MDHPESSAVSFRRRMRRKLYKLASASEFHLHDDVETTNWMRQKVESTLSRIRMAISKVENAIILILGPPGSGKTYLVRSVLSRIHEMKHLNESGEWRIQVVGLESYNHKDEMRCLKELLMKVEKLAHVNITRGISMTFQEVHERLTHALKLLRRSKVYLIVVLEGADVLTKGINDCSITTGSCTRRQGLLYLMGNILPSQDFAFTFICITADIRTTERLEKRVKSRFMHESVYCQNKDDIGQIFGPKGLAILGPKCEATLDTAAKMALSEDIMCGNNVSSLVASACVVLPDDAIEELDGGRIRISAEAISNAIMHTREKTYITKMLEQLTLPEHQILVALTRLHTRRMNPITLLDVEEDLAGMVDHFPSEKHTVPDFQGLLRVFLRLIQVGIVEWVNYEHNWVGSASIRSRVDDFQGANAPCRFAHYRTYLNMDHSKILPSHLSVWLSLAKQIDVYQDTDALEAENRNTMKVVSKGEPVSNTDVLVCIRKRLQDYRRPIKANSGVGENPHDAQPMTTEKGVDSAEQEEWQLRIKKLNAFSLSQESVSESEESHIRFLESLECYLASIG